MPSRTKNQKGIGIKSIYSNTSNCFEYKEICISKLFIIMFIKWKNSREGLCLTNASEF